LRGCLFWDEVAAWHRDRDAGTSWSRSARWFALFWFRDPEGNTLMVVKIR
jgi:hypothetical protein